MGEGYREKRGTRCMRLRALLADGLWHSHAEMTVAGGARFGARRLEVENGHDGGAPWLIEHRIVRGDDTVTEYRLVGPNPHPRPESTAKVRRCCPTCGRRVQPHVSSGVTP